MWGVQFNVQCACLTESSTLDQLTQARFSKVLLLINKRLLVTRATPTTISLLHMPLLAQAETPVTGVSCNEQTFTTVGVELYYVSSL